jgi:hypothetical protein
MLVTPILVSCLAQPRLMTVSNSIEIFPKKTRYARGETINVVSSLNLILSYGKLAPLANYPLECGDFWGEANWTTTLFKRTDRFGKTSFTYIIPTNPRWDNIHVYSAIGVSDLTGILRPQYTTLRIPIGTR